MKAIPKQCSMCPDGVLSPLWKSNPPLCKSHAMIQSAKKNIAEQKEPKKAYDDFCRALWKTRKHVSDLSGAPLPEYNEHSPRFCNLIRFHMHHFKDEGTQSKSKKQLDIVLDENRIVFLTKHEHEIVEFGSPKQKEEIGWNVFSKEFERELYGL